MRFAHVRNSIAPCRVRIRQAPWSTTRLELKERTDRIGTPTISAITRVTTMDALKFCALFGCKISRANTATHSVKLHSCYNYISSWGRQEILYLEPCIFATLTINNFETMANFFVYSFVRLVSVNLSRFIHANIYMVWDAWKQWCASSCTVLLNSSRWERDETHIHAYVFLYKCTHNPILRREMFCSLVFWKHT